MNKVLARLIFSMVFVFLSCISASGADEWRNDFDRLCGYVMEIESYTPEKLRGFVEESDQLLKVMAASNEPGVKVYIFRLKKCRNFFDYMAAVKEDQTRNK